VTPGRLEEGVEMLADHAVQHGVLGVAWPVVAAADRRNDDTGAPSQCQQCPKMDAPQPRGPPRERPRVLGAGGDT